MAGKIHLHHGPNLYHLVEQFLDRYPEVRRTDGSSLYIVPDSAAARIRFLKKRYFTGRDQNAHPDEPFLSHRQFLLRLISRLNLPGVLLSFNQRLILLSHALAAVRQQLNFFRFPTDAASAPVLSGLLHFFDALRLNEETTVLRQSRQLGLQLSAEDRLYNDLYLLYTRYRKLLEGRFLDEADSLRAIIPILVPEILEKYFPGLQIIVWEDPVYFSELHRQLVKRFQELGVDQYLLLQDGRNQQIFEDQKKLRSRLQALAHRREPYSDPENFERALFTLKHPAPQWKKEIFVSDEVNRLQEVRQLAGEVRRLVVDEGFRYNEIAISSPGLRHYLPLLEMVLTRFQIPYQVQESLSLEKSLVVQHLFLPLQLAAEDYRLDILLNLIRSPFYAYRELYDENLLQTALNGLRIRSGRKELLRQIRQAKHYYSHRGTGEEEESARLADVYQRLEKILTAVFEDAAFFEQEHPAREIYRYLVSLIEKHDFSRRILQGSSEEPDALFLTRHEHLAALRHLLETLHFWQRTGPDRRFTARELRAELSPILKLFTYRARRPDSQGLQIIPFSRVTVPTFRALFLLGMEDGVFPATGPTDFVPRQYFPERLQALASDYSLSQERRQFLRILQLPVEKLYFSYPRYQQENPVLPSVFLRELARIRGGELPRAPRTPLFKQNDLLEKAARHSPRWLGEADTLRRLSQLLGEPFSAERHLLLRHQLIVEEKRRQEADAGPWEGNLTTAGTVSRWLQRYYQRAHFSVTQLETFGKCPQIFFFERILRITPEEAAEEFISPLDRGALVHQILFRFYREFTEGERQRETLLALAEEELEKLPVQHGLLWQLEKEFLIGSSDSPGLLEAFWENEKTESANYYTQPRHFEFSFGRIPEEKHLVDPHSVNEPFVYREGEEEFLFKGKIDRVEIAPDGTLLIVDYKTGGTSTFNAMWRGESLQLPIYLLAAEYFLKRHNPAATMGGAAYYQVKSPRELGKRLVFCREDARILVEQPYRVVTLPDPKYALGEDPATLEDFVQRAFGFAARYIRLIRRGYFPHTPESANCQSFWKNCPYLPLCRRNPAKQAWQRNRIRKETADSEEK